MNGTLSDRLLFLTHDQAGTLSSAEYLGEYAAIVLEPTWKEMAGMDSPPPGMTKEVEGRVVDQVDRFLKRRSLELRDFLRLDGVLVVKLELPSGLFFPGNMTEVSASVDTHEWWLKAVGLGSAYRQNEFSFEIGHGAAGVELTEPGHGFEETLLKAKGYTVRLDRAFAELPMVTVLATNRTREPVAAEIRLDRGTAILLPSRIDDATLREDIKTILTARMPLAEIWTRPEELQIRKDYEDVLSRMRQERDKHQKILAGIKAVKAAVLKDADVKRAVAYFRNGTDPTRPIKQAMGDLYKLVEFLEALHGGSEDTLATDLNVPKSRFKSIKKLANQPSLDFRHATKGETSGADAAEVETARADARVLLQAFLNKRYVGEIARMATAAKAKP
jgi:hypothetical protein